MISGSVNKYRALWAGVLLQAIKDLNRKPFPKILFGKAQELEIYKGQAKNWLTRKNTDGPGTFIWVCDLLEIDPSKTRTKILNSRIYIDSF